MNKTESRPNWFVRIGIILLVVFLGALVATSFLRSPPPFRITAGILSVLAMMIVLVLSEAFNSFSLGKILTLSREVQKTREEKEELKSDNAQLRQSLVHVATHVQSQVNTTIQAQGADFLRLLGVVKADEKTDEEEEEDRPEPPADRRPRVDSAVSRHRLLASVESLAMTKYAGKYNFPESEIVRQIRFTDAFEHIDPISNRPVTFDGYLKSPTKEYFIEVKTRRVVMGTMLWDRLYVMLSKVLLYRQAKGIDAELVLLLADLPQEADERSDSNWNRFMELYQPAIASGLLKVETILITSDEIKQIETDIVRQREESSNQLLHRTQ